MGLIARDSAKHLTSGMTPGMTPGMSNMQHNGLTRPALSTPSRQTRFLGLGTALSIFLSVCGTGLPASLAEAAARGEEVPVPVPDGRVALLNFTARSVDPALAQDFSRNLRESFLLEGQVSMLEERELVSALAGEDGTARLKQARVMLAEGKKLFRAGQHAAAAEKLNEARAIHRSLFSELSRADEMSDVLFFQGLNQIRLGKPEAAQMSFVQMFLMDSNFSVDRFPERTAEDNEVLESARRLERAAPLRGISSAFALDITRRLGVSYLLVGVLDQKPEADGAGATLKLVIQAAEQSRPLTTLVFDVEEFGTSVPPVGAPIYRRIIRICNRSLLVQ